MGSLQLLVGESTAFGWGVYRFWLGSLQLLVGESTAFGRGVYGF